MELRIYLVLFFTTAVYAFLLSRFKYLMEPDLTWIEVVVGVTLCLAAPALVARWEGVPTWQAYEALTWRAFLIGGAPIVLWQIGRATRTWRRVERRIRERDGKHDATATMAEERGARTPDDL
jgi:hypothetical protein